MHSPRRTDAEIAEDIVRLLNPESCEEIKATIVECLMMHRELLARIYSRDAVKKNRAAAKRLRDDINRLMMSMEAAPSDVIMVAPPPLKPKIAGVAVQDYLLPGDHFGAFYEYLWGMDEACQRTERKSASNDHSKTRCAELARGLMRKFSRKRPTSYKGSPFRTITSRIFEHVTGERNVDLERACEAALKARPNVR
jgi:hypothetical protein